MDGVMGSTGLDKLKQMQQQQRSNDPGVAGALDVNPDIYEVEAEDLSAEKRGITFELKSSGKPPRPLLPDHLAAPPATSCNILSQPPALS